MRHVETRSPSFPAAAVDQLLTPHLAGSPTWQVLCGDAGHWRVGLYAPALTRREEVRELEQHDCPELFLLIRGRLTLVLCDPAAPGGTREVPLEAGRPILVESPHDGYCPDGPHTGVALVVERDAFDTTYRSPEEWLGVLRAG